MFAKVTNFHWSFQKDGSYDIELNLVSVGDVVESFKINALNSGIEGSNTLITGSDLNKLPDGYVINKMVLSCFDILLQADISLLSF